MKPLIKKLKKCHDPDRWDLIALQKQKREQALQAEDENEGEGGEGAEGKKKKKRSTGVTAPLGLDMRSQKPERDDPFGPPLK